MPRIRLSARGPPTVVVAADARWEHRDRFTPHEWLIPMGVERWLETDNRHTCVTSHRACQGAIERQERRVERFSQRDVCSVVARQVRPQLPCSRDERTWLVQVDRKREEQVERVGDALARRKSAAFDPSQKRAHLEVDVARGMEKCLRLLDPAGDDPCTRRP